MVLFSFYLCWSNFLAGKMVVNHARTLTLFFGVKISPWASPVCLCDKTVIACLSLSVSSGTSLVLKVKANVKCVNGTVINSFSILWLHVHFSWWSDGSFYMIINSKILSLCETLVMNSYYYYWQFTFWLRDSTLIWVISIFYFII